MKKVVERERNKGYYRLLHAPIWIWVFFILPGNLTFALYAHGPDRRHGWWVLAVTLVCVWRAWAGRLPGAEPKPYITYWGVDQPNLPYRVVCYTAAWIGLLVPFALNAIGLVIAVLDGRWIIAELHRQLYYPLALAIVAATALDLTPRAKRSTRHEGAERAWFYVAMWTVVPSQLAGWAVWRLGGSLHMEAAPLAWVRFTLFYAIATVIFVLGARGILPRTNRYHLIQAEPAAPAEGEFRPAPTEES
jgi:hypothetical protein